MLNETMKSINNELTKEELLEIIASIPIGVYVAIRKFNDRIREITIGSEDSCIDSEELIELWFRSGLVKKAQLIESGFTEEEVKRFCVNMKELAGYFSKEEQQYLKELENELF